jgi:gliding motility-associated-like protein
MLRSLILFFFILVSQVSSAQLCQGSLGDPIISIDFGQGPNPGAPLSAAATNYQFVGTDCPQDGFYTLRTNCISCFGNTWHSLQRDHTGNANGYMMVVNASFQPSAFYVDTVRGLCGNTNYEFAAWVINMLVPSSCNGATIQPNLTFRIERVNGTEIAAYNTNDIPPSTGPLWKQYGFNFTTPASGEDIVLRIINNAQGGCGNDIALDDITFRACGPLLVPAISGRTSLSDTLCVGEIGNYTFSCNVSGGFANPALQWQQQVDGGGWTDIAGQNAPNLVRQFGASMPVGQYDFRLTVAESGNLSSLKCRIVSPPITIRIFPLPTIVASINSPVCEGNAAILSATGAAVYSWSGPGGFTGIGSPLPLAQVSAAMAGQYQVTGTTEAGCINTGSAFLVVDPSPVASIAGGDKTICAGDSIPLMASGGGSYEWLPAASLSDATVSNPIASPGVTTVYEVIVTNASLCSDTAFVNIVVLVKPVASAGPDKSIIQGESVQLNGSVNSSGNSITWSPSTNINDTHILQPTVNPTDDAFYILTVSSGFGCGNTSDSVLVKVYKSIHIPNAFSPNGDNVNDTWNIPALAAYNDFKIAVYNRWGQPVYQARNTMMPWDGTFKGKALPMGAYHYFIDLGEREYILKGSVIIIR